MLEEMKGREKAQTENRRRRRKDGKKRRDLTNSLKAGVILRCKYREKALPLLRSFTTGLAQGGIEERGAGRSSLERVVAEVRRVRAGKRFPKNGG